MLAPWLSAGIEHIGSTSVPGLCAKPILDMIAGVGSLEEAAAAIGPLAEFGYVHTPHRPRALRFYRNGPDGAQCTHGLHLTEPGSDLWQERLAFRDALRADPELARRYAELKLALAPASDSVTDYTAGKRALIAEVLARSGITLAPR